MHLVARHCRALWIAPNRPKLRGAIFRLSKRNSQFYKSNHLTILKGPTSSFYLNKDLEKSVQKFSNKFKVLVVLIMSSICEKSRP